MVLCEAVLLLSAVSIMDGLRDLPRILRDACAFLASTATASISLPNTRLVILFRQFLLRKLGAATMVAAMVASHVVAFGLYYLFERHYRQVGALLKRRVVPANFTKPHSNLIIMPALRRREYHCPVPSPFSGEARRLSGSWTLPYQPEIS